VGRYGAARAGVLGRAGLRGAVEISAEKIQTLADFWPLVSFLFDGPVDDPGAFAKTIGKGMIRLEHVDQYVVMAGLFGAIVWDLLTNFVEAADALVEDLAHLTGEIVRKVGLLDERGTSLGDAAA